MSATFIKERYNPVVVAVDSTVTFKGETVGGFLAKTAGTVTITRADGTVIVNAFPVAAGTYNPLPFRLGPDLNKGHTCTTAGGAGGTLAI